MRKLGPLRGRAFRWYFLGSTISALGDAVAQIALAFAVLRLGSLGELGVVLAGRQLASALALLAGGVYGDRLARHRLLVGGALLQGSMQAATAAVVVSGSAPIALLLPLQVVVGLAEGFAQPSQTGLVPQVVGVDELQPANALLQTARSATWIVGPALGGILVAAGSSGLALAIDAASFAVAAVAYGTLALAPLAHRVAAFSTELREGFRAFMSRGWVWKTAIGFGIGNAFHQAQFVLGPALSDRHYGGAGVWAATGTAFAIGTLLGGMLAMRVRPSRPFAVCVASAMLLAPPQFAWGALAPRSVLIGASVLAGIGLALHITLWFSTFQQEIPEELQSRVSSFEALGSFVLNPLGTVLAPVLAAAIGTRATLMGGGLVNVAVDAAMLAMPSVRAIRRASSASTEPS